MATMNRALLLDPHQWSVCRTIRCPEAKHRVNAVANALTYFHTCTPDDTTLSRSKNVLERRYVRCDGISQAWHRNGCICVLHPLWRLWGTGYIPKGIRNRRPKPTCYRLPGYVSMNCDPRKGWQEEDKGANRWLTGWCSRFQSWC